MSRDEKGDEMADRLSDRFSDDSDDTDQQETPDDLDNQDIPDNLDNIDPKEDWTGRMVYVPDDPDAGRDLLTAFDGEYDRLQYECDWEIRKQLHYYPAVVKVGIDEIEEMGGDEFTAVVDELELR